MTVTRRGALGLLGAGAALAAAPAFAQTPAPGLYPIQPAFRVPPTAGMTALPTGGFIVIGATGGAPYYQLYAANGLEASPRKMIRVQAYVERLTSPVVFPNGTILIGFIGGLEPEVDNRGVFAMRLTPAMQVDGAPTRSRRVPGRGRHLIRLSNNSYVAHWTGAPAKDLCRRMRLI